MTGLGYTPRHAAAVTRVTGIQNASAGLSQDACTFSLKGYIEAVPLDHASKTRPLCLIRAGQYAVMAYWFTRSRELDLPWPFATSPVLFLNGDVER